MSAEIIEALMHAEYLAQDELAQEEVHARAWAIVYLLQRAGNPEFSPDNYAEIVGVGRAYNGVMGSDLKRGAH